MKCSWILCQPYLPNMMIKEVQDARWWILRKKQGQAESLISMNLKSPLPLHDLMQWHCYYLGNTHGKKRWWQNPQYLKLSFISYSTTNQWKCKKQWLSCTNPTSVAVQMWRHVLLQRKLQYVVQILLYRPSSLLKPWPQKVFDVRCTPQFYVFLV